MRCSTTSEAEALAARILGIKARRPSLTHEAIARECGTSRANVTFHLSGRSKAREAALTRGALAASGLESGNWKKLCFADVAEIRARRAAGEVPAKLAREFGVRLQTVMYHLNGKALPHPYARALAAASEARRRGENTVAAAQLRAAADLLEGVTAGAVAR